MVRQYGPSKAEIEAKECTDPIRLAALAEHRSSFVRSAVARNRHTASDTLRRLLSGYADKYIRSAAASNPNTPADALMGLAETHDRYVAENLATNPSVPVQVLVTLALSPHPEWRTVAEKAAANPHLPVEVLSELAGSPSGDVRAAVAGNPSTPDEALLRLVPDSAAGRALSRRFRERNTEFRTVISPRLGTEVHIPIEVGGRFSPALIEAFAAATESPVLLKTAAAQPDAPERALLRVARADDVWIRVRVAENPGITERVMLALVAKGGAEPLRALARRDDLPLSVVAALASTRVSGAHQALGAGAATRLLADGDAKARTAAANLLSPGDTDMLEQMLADEAQEVRVSGAKVMDTTALAAHAGHECKAVRAVVADRVSDADALRLLAADSQAPVRRRVVKNRAVPADVLAALASDSDARVRANAAERFMAALSAPVR